VKVYIGPYDHWFQPATWLKSWIHWWYGFGRNRHWHVVQRLKYEPHRELDDLDDWIRRLWLYRGLNIIERWVANRAERSIQIRIDKYDVWNLGDTLALIALPMLYEFKKQGIQGAPPVDDADVPEYLRSTAAPPLTPEEQNTGHVDKLWHQRWRWVVDEMIWAMEQICDPEAGSRFHYDKDPDKPRDEPGLSFEERMDQGEFDKEGYMQFAERKRNGLRLFGVYFEDLWN
jgi:hypothetical protein